MSPKAEINLNLGSILPQSITKITTFSLEDLKAVLTESCKNIHQILET